MLEAKVFLNNNLSNYYYWVEDESMTSTIKYACGYLIKYLLNCKNKNQIEMIKKLKTETNPNHLLLEVKSEVFNYFRFVLIQIHVFLKYETLKKFKNELYIVVYNWIIENKEINEKWFNLIKTLSWEVEQDKESKSFFEKSIAVWTKIWIGDFIKKNRLCPVRNQKTFRNRVDEEKNKKEI